VAQLHQLLRLGNPEIGRCHQLRNQARRLLDRNAVRVKYQVIKRCFFNFRVEKRRDKMAALMIDPFTSSIIVEPETDMPRIPSMCCSI
jgi:hypothetical protein